MSRLLWSRRLLAAATLIGVFTHTSVSLAVGIDAYHVVRSFTLPAPNAQSGGNVLFDALPDGRLLVLNGATVSVETAVASGQFSVVGDVPGFNPLFGPSFLAVSPDGTRAATGANAQAVIVFSTSNLGSNATYFAGDFAGEWIDDDRLAVSGQGVQVIDLATPSVTTVVSGIGGFAGDVAIDGDGNLYASNGFDASVGGSETGWVKAFANADWQAAAATSTPLNFETEGIAIVDLLSASPIGFDAMGNLFVGGGDAFGSSGDTGYAALVDSTAVVGALTAPASTPPITPASPSGVLRRFASASPADSPNWGYNNATGELYLNYLFADGVVTVYAIPEPAAWQLACMVGIAFSAMLVRRRRCRASLAGGAGALLACWQAAPVQAASPYASQIVATTSQFGNLAMYNDPSAVLGEPARMATNNDPEGGVGEFHVAVTQAAYNRDPAGNNLLTTLARRSVGGSYEYGSITVKFDEPVFDDPTNPYGIDFNVFGNAFYAGSDYLDDAADLRSQFLSGVGAEPVLVSVSPDNVNWYTYAAGPFGDTPFPTQGYGWSGESFDSTGSGWTEATDFTKPVNPTLASLLGTIGSGLSAADAIDSYVGAGGGTGFDLAPSGFEWIQYIRVEATAASHGGEIDGFADVRPAVLGDALSLTPANVATGMPLYFQNADAPAETALIAEFTALSGWAKLSTTAALDPVAVDALEGLADAAPLATFQLDVAPLVGGGTVDYLADFRFRPSSQYAGDGNDLGLLAWDGAAWNPLAFGYDSATAAVVLADWSSSSSTLAIVQEAAAASGDFNGDGLVDGADFLRWQRGFVGDLDEWKAGMDADGVDAIGVPEPSAVLLTVVALACLRQRAIM